MGWKCAAGVLTSLAKSKVRKFANSFAKFQIWPAFCQYYGRVSLLVTFIITLLYGTAESRIFHRTPAGHTAERKTRRKRNRSC
jgi:hypothetical protein